MNIFKRTFKAAAVLITLICIVSAVCAFTGDRSVSISRIEFIHADIPDDFLDTKIVFLSDIHHGPGFSIEEVRNLVKTVNSLNPEIVLLGGDYIEGSSRFIKPVFYELKKIRASLFFGGVLGNHDHWQSAGLSRKFMKEGGIEILDDRSLWINKKGQRIKVGGVGDLWEDTQNIERTISGTKLSDFVILLSHNPDYFQTLRTKKIDLVLSGHTHGGQITFFGLWAPVLPIKYKKYWKGFYKNEYSSLFITKGVGTSKLHMRLWSSPEIVEITLKQKSSKE